MARSRNTQKPPPRPTPYATRGAVEDLENRLVAVAEGIDVALNQVLRQQAIMEMAVISLANDVEHLSDVLLPSDPDDDEPLDVDPPEVYDSLVDESEDPHAPDTVETPPESAEDRAVRLEEARAKRQAFADEQRRIAEAANEDFGQAPAQGTAHRIAEAANEGV